MANQQPSSWLLEVHDSVLSQCMLFELPPRLLGLVAVVCVKLRSCAADAVLLRARLEGLERRDGESLSGLLFAMHVLSPTTMTTWGPLCNVVCGMDHVAIISSEGELFTFGDGRSGKLGHGSEEDELVARRVEVLVGKRVTQVSCGGYHHTAVITLDGELHTFGYGHYGQLGHGGVVNEWVPRRVEALVGKCVVQVSCGHYHTAVVTSTGELFTFGQGRYGKLGHDTQNNEWVPRRVEALVGKRVVQVSCGNGHTAVITSEGELHTFGEGGFWKLGHGSRNKNELMPRRVEALVGKRVVQVSCGEKHTAVVTSGGGLLTFGLGISGQLGHGDKKDGSEPQRVETLVGKRVVQVACCYHHTAVVTSIGELLTFGEGVYGQLGHSGYEDELAPRRVEALAEKCVVRVACGSTHIVIITSTGELLTFGDGEVGLPQQLEALMVT